MVVVPIAHHFVQAATVHTARLVARLLDEMAKTAAAWRKRHVVDVAVRGIGSYQRRASPCYKISTQLLQLASTLRGSETKSAHRFVGMTNNRSRLSASLALPFAGSRPQATPSFPPLASLIEKPAIAVVDLMNEVSVNPARSVVRLKGEREERFLNAEEFERLFHALEAAERDGAIHYRHAAIIRLLAYTGCRKTEILGLKWSEVDGAVTMCSRHCATAPQPTPSEYRNLGARCARWQNYRTFDVRQRSSPFVRFHCRWRRRKPLCRAARSGPQDFPFVHLAAQSRHAKEIWLMRERQTSSPPLRSVAAPEFFTSSHPVASRCA